MTTKRVPKKPEELRVWIEGQLKLNRSSYAAIGRQLSISRQAVRKGILKPSQRIAKAVSEVIGLPEDKIWNNRSAA